jgi:hypothetical protein
MLQPVKFLEVTFVARRTLTVNTLPTSEIDIHNLTPEQKAELISCLDRYPEPPVWQIESIRHTSTISTQFANLALQLASSMDDNEILSWCEKISQTIDGVPFCASEREIGDDRDSLINFIADTQWIWQIVPPPGMASFPTTESA